MPNIFKRFSQSKAEPYQFPDTLELLQADAEAEERARAEAEERAARERERQTQEQEQQEPARQEPALDPSKPIDYARLQADAILQDAQRQAEELLERSRQDAERRAEEVLAAAREEGHREGYAQGMAQAMEESVRQREEQAVALEREVGKFLERANAALDRQLDENIGELRDLALAVAEKVVCVSLKSSSEVISRMIQAAVDKRRRREWAHIYIAECDAKAMTQVPASLTAALSALSDRVRVIPMAEDEPGTCIIEMPDEIIDASAATQLSNLRELLMDAPTSSTPFNLF